MKVLNLGVSLLTLTLMACGSSGGDLPLKQYTDMDAASCEYKAYDGLSARSHLLSNKNLQRTHFGKSYDSNWLEAVLSASAEETVKVARQTGVIIYKGSWSGNGCNFFDFLMSPPSDLAKQWENVQSVNKNSILGVYLPAGTNGLWSVSDTPAILVREQSDRYTLVHEYMHHNFSSHRQKETGVSDQALKTRMELEARELTRLVERTNSFSSDSELKQLAAATAAIFTTFDELSVRYFLEEATIENLLGSQYEQGRLTYVTRTLYTNGGHYIRSSAKEYESKVGWILKEVEKLVKDSMERSPEIRQAFRDARSKFSSRKIELASLVSGSWNRRFSDEMTSKPSPSEKHSAEAPCNHVHEFDGIVAATKSAFDKALKASH